MINLLIIQNLSEIQNNSYCDTSGLWNRFDKKCVFITRDNLDILSQSIDDSQCIVFASNCLRDEQILKAFMSDEIRKKMADFVKRGNSCLFLHQLMPDGTELNLFDGIDELSFTIKKNADKNGNGLLEFSSSLYLAYQCFPNELDLKEIYNRSREFVFVPGIFWHTYYSPSMMFNAILEDSDHNILISVAKNYPVIYASMILDWQLQKELLENLITNLYSGGKCIGIVHDKENKDISYMELTNSLNERKVCFYVYDASSEADLLLMRKRIDSKCHSMILLDTDVLDLNGEIYEKCYKQGINCIRINADSLHEYDKTLVWHDNYQASYQMLTQLEIEVQKVLGNMLIENSFSTTIQVLKLLLDSGKPSGNYEIEKLQIVMDYIEKHLMSDGSYDYTFGATCRMLWFFKRICKQNNPIVAKRIAAAKAWLKNMNTDLFRPRELIELAYACDEDLNSALEKCFQYDLDAEATVYDLIEMGSLAQKQQRYDLERICIEKLVARKESIGYSEDELMKFCMILTRFIAKGRFINAEEKDKYSALLVSGISDLQSWDPIGKNIAKNIEKCLLFIEYEKLIHHPIDTILKLHEVGDGSISAKLHDHVSMIEDYRVDVYVQGKQIENLRNKNRNLSVFKNAFWIAVICMIPIIYLSIWLLVWLGENAKLGEMFRDIIVSYWQYHTVLVSALVAATSGIVSRIIKKNSEKHLDELEK